MNEELYLGRGQNEGHLHPKRRFRRSFLAFLVMLAVFGTTDDVNEPELTTARSCE